MVTHKGLSQQFVENVSYFREDSIHTRLAMTKQPIYKQYFELIYTSKDRVCQLEGLRATAIIPVWHKNKLLTVFYFASHTEDNIPNDVRTMVEIFAAQMGSFIYRLKAEEKLSEFENELRVIFENNPLKFVKLLVGLNKDLVSSSQEIDNSTSRIESQSLPKWANCLALVKEKVSHNASSSTKTNKLHKHANLR